MALGGPSAKKIKALIYESLKAPFSKCFAPGPACKGKAIQAHSIQNARVFDLLAKEGKVSMIEKKLNLSGPFELSFALEGRNRASTFAGLCKEHDESIFKPIDNSPLDVASPEHRFLVAYRTTLYGAHSTGATAMRLERVMQGLSDMRVPLDAGLIALLRRTRAARTLAQAALTYKGRLDQAYAKGAFGELTHDLIEIDVTQPTLACSTLFHLEVAGAPPTMVAVALSVFPLAETRTVAFLSYLNDHAAKARAVHAQLLNATDRKYELSRLVLNRSENFVLAPVFTEGWSEEKRKAVEGMFTETVEEPDFDRQDPHLLLFA